VVRLADRESGLSARTIARRLSSVSGLYAYLVARGDTPVQVNPVPRGLMTRRQGGTMRSRMAPLVRVPRTLPRVLSPEEADRLVGALRRHRDRAMVLGMLLAGLRRCEVLGLRFADVQVADRRLAVVAGKGGHHRVVPAANRFFDELGAYLHHERPGGAGTDRVFVVLKGPRRGLPLSAEGLDEILAGARRRAGLEHATCHQLRHTCLTRLRETGMALEAVQAQAGHASIESTRVYLHLANDWLAGGVPAGRRADRRRYHSGRRDAGRAAAGRPVSGQPARSPATGRAVTGSTAAAEWAQIEATAPQVAALVRRYLRQLGTFLAPASVNAAENALRQFARWMITEAGLDSIGVVRRDDIEDYKVWLAARPGQAARRSPRRRTGSGCGLSASSSSGSSSGTGRTRRPATPSSPGTSPRNPSRCRSSSTTATPPS
jgi:site-specific recombinase XerD